jgi:galactose-1-phosphate uridylyltransferase
MRGFERKEAVFEIRRDEISGVTSGILPYRFRMLERQDPGVYLEKSPGAICPFCPDLIEALTPRFTPDICAEGRFRRGRAVLFPNAFPYDRHNAVIALCPDHFVGLDALNTETMTDGFLLAWEYFERMAEAEPDLRFASLNWNYMPPAGGGLVHPHLQTILGGNPTRFPARLLRGATDYRVKHGRSLWADFLKREQDLGERYCATTGSVAWLASFAPKGMGGEVSFFFPETTALRQVRAALKGFLDGLTCVFAYLHANNFISFNLALYGALHEDVDFPVQGRITPRFSIPPLGTSDINYIEKYHDEVICPVVPEDFCRDLRPFFAKGGA